MIGILEKSIGERIWKFRIPEQYCQQLLNLYDFSYGLKHSVISRAYPLNTVMASEFDRHVGEE